MNQLTTELGKFRVLPGKEPVVTEWMAFLTEHLSEVLLTLDQEKMYVEAIFQEKEGETTYLYWFSVQGENPVEVENSDFEVDKKHVEYWNECIDPVYKQKLLQTNVVMIPERIRKYMK